VSKGKGLNKSVQHQFLDQLAHTAVMIFVMVFAVAIAPPYGGLLAGLTVAALAEYKEGGYMLSVGSLLDMLVYAVAGAAVQTMLV
jgi:hypothetical protein